MDLDYYCEQFNNALVNKKDEILRTIVLGYANYVINKVGFEQKKSTLRCLHLRLGDLSSYVSTERDFYIMVPESNGKLGHEEKRNVCSLLFGPHELEFFYNQSRLRSLASSENSKTIQEAMTRFNNEKPDLCNYYHTFLGVVCGYDIKVNSFKKKSLFSKGRCDVTLSKKKAIEDLETALALEFDRRGIKVFALPSYITDQNDELLRSLKTDINDIPPTKQKAYDELISKLIEKKYSLSKQKEYSYINEDLDKIISKNEKYVEALFWQEGRRNNYYRSTVDLFFVDKELLK